MAAPLKKTTHHLGHALPGITTTSPNYAMAAPLEPRPRPQPTPILPPPPVKSPLPRGQRTTTTEIGRVCGERQSSAGLVAQSAAVSNLEPSDRKTHSEEAIRKPSRWEPAGDEEATHLVHDGGAAVVLPSLLSRRFELLARRLGRKVALVTVTARTDADADASRLETPNNWGGESKPFALRNAGWPARLSTEQSPWGI
ncbi:hypothetical protein E2562_021129 [Oryza meyeriana var. granulata]|uniref:Uncharacterized protein n=1 Tax=Oryza meyeriana var. granulata TaxID=110450 RepID=A0A6G1BNW4_9ORYZ|nr:hypothetical protein E2562_021129 [Oryza meyeriana var. granulata]